VRFDGKLLELVALHNMSDPKGIDAIRQAYPRPPGRGGATDRAILTRGTVHIPDVWDDPEYQYHALARAAGYRSHLSVPMLCDGEPVGAITVAGASAGAFSRRQIDLLQTFADQAVIAIENVRLFDEVQARTAELSEALEQQTATSEVLGVMSSSPGELDPVFQVMLENAVRICEAGFGNLYLREGHAFRIVAMHGAPPAYAEARKRDPVPTTPGFYPWTHRKHEAGGPHRRYQKDTVLY
jgi:two-component system, NtrC family, sensor kinase